MGVYDLILPDDACNMGEEEMLSVLVHNFGYADQDTFQMSYSIDDGEVATETFTTNIPAYLSDTLSFFTPADFSECGAHTVKVWTSLAGDTVPANDTLVYTVTNICATATTTGIPHEVCAFGGPVTADPEVALGYWEGTGITDTATGTFDPALVGAGNSTIISYTYSTAVGYTKITIPYEMPDFTDPVVISLLYDDDVDTLMLPFDFLFFSDTYDTIYPASNGYFCFGEPHDTWYINIPSVLGINNLVGLAGDDLNPAAGGSIYYSVEGIAPNRKFQLRYAFVPLHWPPIDMVDVAAILYESTNIIDIIVHHLPEEEDIGFAQGISNIDGSQYYLTKDSGNPRWFDGANDTAFRFTPTLCPRTIVDTITVIGDVSKNVLGTDTMFCWGDSITIRPDTTSSYYLWNTGDTTQEITVDTEGYYAIEMEYLPGCALFDTLFAEEIDSIELAFTTTPVILGISDGTAIVEVESGGLPPFTYLWGTGETTSDIVVEESGIYGVTVTDAFGCTTFGTVVVGEDVAIDSINQNDLLSIYPNPAHNTLYIDIKDNFAECSVYVYSLTGSKVITQYIDNNQTSLNISSLNEGLYAIVIHIDNTIVQGYFEKL
ncbi:MAG: T9SS type A sorting domain-containing protein [Chitinophagales bacterium]